MRVSMCVSMCVYMSRTPRLCVSRSRAPTMCVSMSRAPMLAGMSRSKTNDISQIISHVILKRTWHLCKLRGTSFIVLLRVPMCVLMCVSMREPLVDQSAGAEDENSNLLN